jgi:hypothetical protein
MTPMQEFWEVTLLVLLATTVTGALVAGVAHYAATTRSRRGRRLGRPRPPAGRKARGG